MGHDAFTDSKYQLKDGEGQGEEVSSKLRGLWKHKLLSHSDRDMKKRVLPTSEG